MLGVLLGIDLQTAPVCPFLNFSFIRFLSLLRNFLYIYQGDMSEPRPSPPPEKREPEKPKEPEKELPGRVPPIILF
jgi:hypothetical protein